MNFESFRVAIALRVGVDVCIPNSCRWAGRRDSKGLHGLSCKYSADCFPSHLAMDDVVERTLQKAGLPSVIEPPDLDKGDGSRPEGITVFPLSGGRSLVWDFTCDDTFAGVHLNRSAMEAGTAANRAEERKLRKHAALAEAH